MYRRVIAICMGRSIERQDGEDFERRVSGHFQIGAAPYVADVTRGVNSLYVYCPLVELKMVGDAQVPLLRIVPVAGRDGEMMK